jgi:hypothetical protein
MSSMLDHSSLMLELDRQQSRFSEDAVFCGNNRAHGRVLVHPNATNGVKECGFVTVLNLRDDYTPQSSRALNLREGLVD